MTQSSRKFKRAYALNRNTQTVKDEEMNKRNREVNDKGDSILARWRLQGERELNLCNTEKQQRKGGKTSHREHARSLSHTNSLSLTPHTTK